jgi:hypothetical protein
MENLNSLDQVRKIWLYHKHILWNAGTLECWNNGFGGVGQIAIERVITLKIRPHLQFIPHYSIFPSFHYSIGNFQQTTPLWGGSNAWASGLGFLTGNNVEYPLFLSIHRYRRWSPF